MTKAHMALHQMSLQYALLKCELFAVGPTDLNLINFLIRIYTLSHILNVHKHNVGMVLGFTVHFTPQRVKFVKFGFTGNLKFTEINIS